MQAGLSKEMENSLKSELATLKHQKLMDQSSIQAQDAQIQQLKKEKDDVENQLNKLLEMQEEFQLKFERKKQKENKAE